MKSETAAAKREEMTSPSVTFKTGISGSAFEEGAGSEKTTFQFAIEDYGPPTPEEKAGPTESRKSHWISSIINMKTDLNRSIKRARGKLRKQKDQNGSRTIKVDFGKHSRKSRDASPDPYDMAFDQPDNNFSRSLVLTGLQDGMFCAELPLDSMPKGDLTIRISNHKLIFIVQKPECAKYDRKHKVCQPYSCGYIELPIYVDPGTLQFEIYPGQEDILSIKASLKGLMTRSQSCSTKELLTVPTVACVEERKSRSCGASPIVHMKRSKSASRQMSVTPEDIRNDLDKFKDMHISYRPRERTES